MAGHHTEVVGDENEGHVPLATLILDEIEDLSLHRDVESSGGLIGEENRRAAGQGHGDHHALAHAARQFVRVLLETLLGFGDADVLEKLENDFLSVLAGGTEVDAQRFGQLLADLHDRIQRGHRILEDHRHLGAPDLLAILQAHGGELGSLEEHRALADHVATGEQTHDRTRKDRLAAARLAHDAQPLAVLKRERHTVDGTHHTTGRDEVGSKIVDLEKGAAFAADCGLQGAHPMASRIRNFSLNASPSKLMARTVRNRTMDGMIEIHHAVSSLAWPPKIMAPQVGVGALTESPR